MSQQEIGSVSAAWCCSSRVHTRRASSAPAAAESMVSALRSSIYRSPAGRCNGNNFHLPIAPEILHYAISKSSEVLRRIALWTCRPIKTKINDDNDGASATIGRSPAICLARIRCRIDAVWRSDQGLSELRLYGRTYRTLRLLSQ